ncbi:MAG: MATE family efflux transporter [Evtepia sp.]
MFWVLVFCLAIGGLVCCFAPQLLAIFVGHDAQEVISVGTGYLRIEGSCYLGIGILFLLCGYFRAVDRPAVSLVLTVCSLGTRVALAYLLSASPPSASPASGQRPHRLVFRRYRRRHPLAEGQQSPQFSRLFSLSRKS